MNRAGSRGTGPVLIAMVLVFPVSRQYAPEMRALHNRRGHIATLHKYILGHEPQAAPLPLPPILWTDLEMMSERALATGTIVAGVFDAMELCNAWTGMKD